VAKHRRSPTAPEAHTTSGMIGDPNASSNGIGKTWAGTGVDRVEREDDYEYGGVASFGERERGREIRTRKGNGDGKEKRARKKRASTNVLTAATAVFSISQSAPTLSESGNHVHFA
jgi:serine/threonine-protein kinase TTK/MPS1